MTFRVGQKVVCVDASGNAALVMKSGDVFTVLGFGPANSIEIDCKPINDLKYSRFWFSRRFRPIVERKTDISFAHEILRKVSDRVRA